MTTSGVAPGGVPNPLPHPGAARILRPARRLGWSRVGGSWRLPRRGVPSMYPTAVRYGRYRLAAVDHFGALNGLDGLEPRRQSQASPGAQHGTRKELHRCASAGQCPVTNTDCHRLKAPTCYVEVTSFKFIRFSAFCPEGGREASERPQTFLLVAGNARPRGSR
jgi:hypothetical protein